MPEVRISNGLVSGMEYQLAAIQVLARTDRI
ncbi:hypothetical protein YPC_2212 [Yersinia pestis biovar Medievalis str. Harbin 35]|nr:hypothetical protein YPC_2212 [Yersinia pestis biovar Medievalis str. Harbin 35]EEO77017.1 hypothetical protein YP516_1749 [Yersinia pestis Nepal516]EEO80798.1 hypothetical protein YPF_2591 [Yersinia pestis biovar Orientalis str. India 195]EEO83905.1 hypothetical protein YPH_4551 [Yersinia pestis biovar Orientalis str. PEXU2]